MPDLRPAACHALERDWSSRQQTYYRFAAGRAAEGSALRMTKRTVNRFAATMRWRRDTITFLRKPQEPVPHCLPGKIARVAGGALPR